MAQTWKILRGMMARIHAADLSLVAAGGAFFAMLSLFPGLAAIIAVLGFFADPSILDDQLDLLAEFLPEQAFVVLETQIRRLVAANDSVLGWATVISTLTALWSARRGTDALITAINRIFAAPLRGGIMANLMAVAITLTLIVVVVLAMIAMVVLPIVLALLPLGPAAGIALETGRWAVALTVVLTGIWVIYRFAPNAQLPRIRWITPGAVLAVVIWAALSAAFSIYLANFGSYNEVYGSIGAVVALLLWFYISAYIVLFGALLNAELELQTGHDTTVGAARPAGERDAYVADYVVGPEGSVQLAKEAEAKKNGEKNGAAPEQSPASKG